MIKFRYIHKIMDGIVISFEKKKYQKKVKYFKVTNMKTKQNK